MAETKQSHDVHVYPNGLEEQPGGPVPLFLKLTYVGFTIFGITYFALYRAGDGSPLVQVLNAFTR